METTDENADLHLAIQRLSEKQQKQNEDCSVSDIEDRILLSRLLLQLESLKGDDPKLKQLGVENLPSAAGEMDARGKALGESGGNNNNEIGPEEILKELKQVKRQNTITHWLLSVMIVLTVTWQLSEVSILLKVKDGLSHPFRSIGGMLWGMLRVPRTSVKDAKMQLPSSMQQAPEAPTLPPIEVPQLPHLELPSLGLNGEKE